MPVLAALGAVELLGVLPQIFDRRAELSISPQGLFYRPFSPQTIPWSDITAVAVNHRQVGPILRLLWTPHLRTDSINFDVVDAGQLKRGIPFIARAPG